MMSSNEGTIFAVDVETAVQGIVPHLDDKSNVAPVIYYHGWFGLGASTVLRAIAEHPPSSLRQTFDKIIHIDCSRWKSRRALQMAITDELKLTQQVAADFDRQDKEDDFRGVDQGSRTEIGGVATVIARYLAQHKFLVVFHNGSDGVVDLTTYGIPPPQLFGSKVLWCFSGRLRPSTENLQVKQSSHLFLHAHVGDMRGAVILAQEAREISFYTHNLGLGVTPEIAKECCFYLLALNGRGRNMVGYNWANHASSYWVCEGIIGGQDNRAWDLAHALQQYIRLDDDSSFNTATFFGLNMLDISAKHWICSTYPNLEEVPPGTTSLFFEPKDSEWWGRPILSSLPSDTFHKAYQLRVLKLWRCIFSFSSPPFHCCCNLRFLGLDSCVDEQKIGEEETGTLAMETFQRLWVLDVCHTDWQLDFPLGTKDTEQVATQTREVHINNGKIWRNNLAWRQLPNLRKLRVVKPLIPWETGKQDEFMDMVNLELLDLSGNCSMQVLPSLSGATSLKTLVLDGCVGLEHVGPQGLPPSLESFSLDAGKDNQNEARLSCIILAGCARLSDFRLRGPFPNLKDLDLSHTAIKVLALRREVVQVENLQRLFLMRCDQLRSVSWPLIYMNQLRLLWIDTRAGEVDRKALSCDSLMVCQDKVTEYCCAFVALADMMFLLSLRTLWSWSFIKFKLNLCWSSTGKNNDGRICHKEKMGQPHSTGQSTVGSPLPMWLDEEIAASTDCSSNPNPALFLQPLDFHMEIGEGINDVTANMVSEEGRRAIRYFVDRVQSLHVHDSSSITSVVPEHIFIVPEVYDPVMNELKWCRVERCPKLDTVFGATNYYRNCFPQLEIFWAAHLLMARSVWSRPKNPRWFADASSFTRLRAIYLEFCPRLRFVLTLASNTLPKVLETLHIHCCGDLRQVFPVEKEFLEKIVAASDEVQGMLGFPNLVSLYLYDLPSLQQICEAKMFAPKLKTIYIKACWGLRRLPATDRRCRGGDSKEEVRGEEDREEVEEEEDSSSDNLLPSPPLVECEKDWWDKLEWDGMESGHHPSLFQPSHSKYYKKRCLGGTVLR